MQLPIMNASHTGKRNLNFLDRMSPLYSKSQLTTAGPTPAPTHLAARVASNCPLSCPAMDPSELDTLREQER